MFARIGSPEIADDLLSKMKKRYDAGDTSLKPDTVCYSSVVDAYARKGRRRLCISCRGAPE